LDFAQHMRERNYCKARHARSAGRWLASSLKKQNGGRDDTLYRAGRRWVGEVTATVSERVAGGRMLATLAGMALVAWEVVTIIGMMR
jgi:hypothetical protein